MLLASLVLWTATGCSTSPVASSTPSPHISTASPATTSPPPLYNGPTPPGGFQLGMAYESVRNELVALNAVGNPLAFETWTWNGQVWTRLHPAATPETILSLAFDAARGKVLGFGKNPSMSNETVAPGETWTWDGVSWHLESPKTKPVGRSHPILVYDSKRGRTVMFGGAGRPNERLTDTWSWDGSDWTRLADLPMTDNAPQYAAYDPMQDRILTFEPTGYVNTREMLFFDGNGWSQRTITNAELPMTGPLAYFAPQGHLILFGDELDSLSHPVNSVGGPPSTWAWNGSDWQKLDVGTGPFNRLSSVLAYDSSRRVLVLFGGYALGPANTPAPSPSTCCSQSRDSNDIWEFAGSRWILRAAGT